jgi:hypothetical protein
MAKESVHVTHADVLQEMPDHDVVSAWARGEDPEW